MVNYVFANPNGHSSSALIFGAILFGFQIYGDFSGYSDIAIGTARLFGFKLRNNFAYPYFSRDMAEFWRRWHISLSTWFRDYLYIPLGGSRGGVFNKIRNTFVIFLVSGFWHGPSWTFVFWGFLNALYFIPLLIVGKHRSNMEIVASNRLLPDIKEIFMICLTFTQTSLAWIFFRSESLDQAFEFIQGIISPSILSFPYIIEAGTGHAIFPSVYLSILTLFMITEWFGRRDNFAIQKLGMKWSKIPRRAMYYVIVVVIFYFGKFHDSTFIYFQF